MINKITFTGREEMLTAGLAKGIKKSYEYVGAGKIYGQKEIDSAAKAMKENAQAIVPTCKYTSPFDVIKKDNSAAITALKQANALNLSYASSHGNPSSGIEQLSFIA